MSNLYKVSEIAELLKVSEQSVKNWIKDNKIEYYQLPTGTIRISQEQLDNFLNQKSA